MTRENAVNGFNVAKLFSFRGRIGRGAYWLIGIALNVAFVVAESLANRSDGSLLLALAVLVFLPVWFVVSLATVAKRCHDRDKSGWWTLLALVPVIGWLWALIELGFLRGTGGDNTYGAASSGSPLG
jgi:uncharacterized membrane protein YhaH (DUF805 family)